MKKRKAFVLAVVAALLLSACGGSKEAEMATSEAVTEESGAKDEKNAGESTYSMLQGIVREVAGDGESFTLLADDGTTYDIAMSDIADVETELSADVQIAIACIGKPAGDLSGVTLVVALPEQEEWSIMTKTGVTTYNAMSSFVMETKDGETIAFLKDNCPMESGALSGDNGDCVEVTYVTSMDDNYPITIRIGQED